MIIIFILLIYHLCKYIYNQLNTLIPLPPHRQNADNSGQMIDDYITRRNLYIEFSTNQDWFTFSSRVSLFKTITVKYLSKIVLLNIPYISIKFEKFLTKII